MNPGITPPLGLALLGLLLGMRHATDPDHVIAVTTILSRERRLAAAARIGIVWGLGHTVTVLGVGAAIIVFKLGIPARLGLAMEFAVAIVLILLGLGSATNLLKRVFSRASKSADPDRLLVHSHPHVHGDTDLHRHPHVHAFEASTAQQNDVAPLHDDHRLPSGFLPAFSARRPLLKSFGVGLVHGLAGSAAIALLVLSAIPDAKWATLYLAIFCAGTIVGMALITTAIGAPFIAASRRMTRLHSTLVMGSGLLSTCFGLFLAYQIGIVDHLFGIAPIWAPH